MILQQNQSPCDMIHVAIISMAGTPSPQTLTKTQFPEGLIW